MIVVSTFRLTSRQSTKSSFPKLRDMSTHGFENHRHIFAHEKFNFEAKENEMYRQIHSRIICSFSLWEQFNFKALSKSKICRLRRS